MRNVAVVLGFFVLIGFWLKQRHEVKMMKLENEILKQGDKK